MFILENVCINIVRKTAAILSQPYRQRHRLCPVPLQRWISADCFFITLKWQFPLDSMAHKSSFSRDSRFPLHGRTQRDLTPKYSNLASRDLSWPRRVDVIKFIFPTSISFFFFKNWTWRLSNLCPAQDSLGVPFWRPLVPFWRPLGGSSKPPVDQMISPPWSQTSTQQGSQ